MVTLQEKKWTKCIYELELLVDKVLKYRLAIYDYPSSTLSITKFINNKTKQIYNEKVTKDNLTIAIKYFKYLAEKFKQKDYEKYRRDYESN